MKEGCRNFELRLLLRAVFNFKISLSVKRFTGLRPAENGCTAFLKAGPDLQPQPLEVIAWKLDNIPALLARPNFHEARALAALYLVNQS